MKASGGEHRGVALIQTGNRGSGHCRYMTGGDRELPRQPGQQRRDSAKNRNPKRTTQTEENQHSSATDERNHPVRGDSPLDNQQEHDLHLEVRSQGATTTRVPPEKGEPAMVGGEAKVTSTAAPCLIGDPES